MEHPGTPRLPRAELARAVVVVALALGVAFGVVTPASARCATVGVDSISHTQCNLP